jgi:hypothetical protein
MDRALDGGEGWRRDIVRNLPHLGINWLDPTNKPIDIGKEDDESRAVRRRAKKDGDWDTVSKEMKPIRCVDLRSRPNTCEVGWVGDTLVPDRCSGDLLRSG